MTLVTYQKVLNSLLGLYLTTIHIDKQLKCIFLNDGLNKQWKHFAYYSVNTYSPHIYQQVT